jgi:hypothetical protein
VITAAAGTGTPEAVHLDLVVADVSNGGNDKNEKISGTKYTTKSMLNSCFILWSLPLKRVVESRQLVKLPTN